MTGKRKRYSAEFKAKVALEAIKQGGADDGAAGGEARRPPDADQCLEEAGGGGMATVFSGKAEATETARADEGFKRIELVGRDVGDEVEFVTIMWFTSWEAVKALAGEDYETAYVPAAARAVLRRFDARSRHYEVRAQEAP